MRPRRTPLPTLALRQAGGPLCRPDAPGDGYDALMRRADTAYAGRDDAARLAQAIALYG